MVTNGAAELEESSQLAAGALFRSSQQKPEPTSEHQHSHRKKSLGISGSWILTNVKQIQKAFIFTNGEVGVKWREKFFSGTTFAIRSMA